MLLEAPQIWRMKRYNVLETELVYSTVHFQKRLNAAYVTIMGSMWLLGVSVPTF